MSVNAVAVERSTQAIKWDKTEEWDKEDVEALLHYFTPSGEKPYRYNYPPPANARESNAEHQPHRVSIQNLRPIATTLSLEEQGGLLVASRSAVNDFYHDEEVRNTYYRESERVIAQATGAKRIFVFDHTRRRREAALSDTGGTQLRREPVTRVHNDYTVRSGPQRVRDLLPEEAARLLQGRFAIINLWRPIRGPLQDAPLAFCDASSVAFEDFVPMDLLYPNRVGETYLVKFNRAHRWYYVPRMQSDEALLIKSYDSAADGRARFTPHSAFEDPTAPADRLPRESIELRALAFY